MMKWTMAMVVALAGFLSCAAFEIPKASAKALGVTRGKKFSSGIVFVNGKYLPPPYTVARWGTGIRINGKPVTGEIIEWSEFVKTQSGVKVTKTVTEAPAAATVETPAEEAPAPAAALDEEDEEDSSLDDLFDDDPKPVVKKQEKAKPTPKKAPVVRKAPPKPKTTVSYSFDGEFEPNETTKGFVAKINAVRTDIDRTLRTGGFICFGDRYSRISGDERTAKKLIETLPELMQHAESGPAFRAAARAAGLVYLTDALCDEIYDNRIDYRTLQERRAKMKEEQRWNQMLNGVSL